MASTTPPTGSVAREIALLFAGSSVAGMSDHELLDRFTARRDTAGEQAFAALVTRHGPMVFGVCNEVLGDRDLAEDAFQAVFLILARKARAIRDPDLLGNWLYGVALRTARCARIRRGRRRQNESTGSMLKARSIVALPSAEQSLFAREESELLHDEIERLPRAFRLPVVLCYLEGLTVHEVARRLGCSHGTVRSRMARARERLRRGLVRRGVGLPATALAVGLANRTASASLSPQLREAATCAAIQVAAGRSGGLPAASLARQVLRSMMFQKLKFISLALLVFGAIATSAGYLTRALARSDDPRPSPVGVRSVTAATQEGVPQHPDPERIVITGRAVGPDGKPVAGARVAIVAFREARPHSSDQSEPERYQVLGSAKADALGRFQVDFPRTALDDGGLTLVVGATGWALTGRNLTADLGKPDQAITVEPEHVVRGRIFDLQGQPIAGVTVRVTHYETLPYDAEGDAPPWPAPATTDDKGRFELRGLGRRATVMLETRSDRHAPQTLNIDHRDESKAAELTITLSPAQVIEVHTFHADDGKPVTGTLVSVLSRRARQPGLRATSARTNEQGLARIIPSFGDTFTIYAIPPAGESYLNQRTEINLPKGALRQSVELKLKRGLRMHGTVTEEVSEKPVAGALVSYLQTRRNNKLYDRDSAGMPCDVVTGADGKFEIVVPAGPGHLLVRAATPDFLHLTTTNPELGRSILPNGLMYPDALAHIDLKPGQSADEVTMRLRRGVTVSTRVIGPDGEPIARAIAVGRSYAPYGVNGVAFTLGWGNVPQLKFRDGRLDIPGCDPDKPYTFYLLDREQQLGATVELTGKSARNGPVTVQLQKCGVARVRYVDKEGKPIAGHRPDQLILIITPGTDTPQADKTMADFQYQENLVTQRLRQLRTDADGRVTVVSLIPGATYRFHGQDFTCEAGKTIDLPDVTVSRP